jgi:hypothetical protein
MKKLFLTLAMTALLAGCGSAHSAAPASPHGGEDFLPAYVHELTSPHPDNACHPQTLADLLAPCDEPVDIHHLGE